jgi:hypothetical protein
MQDEHKNEAAGVEPQNDASEAPSPEGISAATEPPRNPNMNVAQRPGAGCSDG